MKLRAHYYQQFDADRSREVPEEGFGGWRLEKIELPPERTALVSMHAWRFGPPERYPGLYRASAYLDRAEEILRTVYPPLLGAARRAGMHLFHVVGGGGDYFRDEPGYRETVRLAGEPPEAPPGAPEDPLAQRLQKLRTNRVYPGEHNVEDCRRAHAEVEFPASARPLEGEPIAENAHQLNAVCRDRGVSHLVYVGFAVNWCLLMSPGGMLDMSRRGYLCSVVRQATTAVENRRTARTETCSELALWRVAVAFGFVFDAPDLIAALGETG